MKFLELVVDFQSFVIQVNTIGAKMTKVVPGELEKVGLKVHCGVGKEGEESSMGADSGEDVNKSKI